MDLPDAPARPGRIPIRIHPSFLILTVLLGSSSRDPARIVVWVLIVFVSVLLHELGHAVAARAFGFAPRIELHGMGGTTHYAEGVRTPIGPLRRAVISLAGPLSGIALGLVVFFSLRALPPGSLAAGSLALYAVTSLLWVNVGWGVLNLLPVLPLDGGQVLYAVLDAVTKGRGFRPAATFSLVLAALLGALAVYASSWWSAMLLGLFAFQNYSALRAKPAVAGAGDDAAADASASDDATSFASKRDAARLLLSARDPGALAAAKDAVALSSNEAERTDAAQLLAAAYLLEKNVERAQIVLETMIPEAEKRAPVLVAQLHMARGEAEKALALARGADASSAELRLGLWALEVDALRALGRADEIYTRWQSDPALRALGYRAGAYATTALFYGGRDELCARLCAALFEQHGHPEAAYNAACAHVRLGALDEADRWLERAAGAGYSDAAGLESDEDLAPLRGREAFARALAQVRRNAG